MPLVPPIPNFQTEISITRNVRNVLLPTILCPSYLKTDPRTLIPDFSLLLTHCHSHPVVLCCCERLAKDFEVFSFALVAIISAYAAGCSALTVAYRFTTTVVQIPLLRVCMRFVFACGIIAGAVGGAEYGWAFVARNLSCFQQRALSFLIILSVSLNTWITKSCCSSFAVVDICSLVVSSNVSTK
jgi:hypothetical protein